MEEECGPASWIAAALPIDAVLATHSERPTVVWLDRRKLSRHTCDSLPIAASSRRCACSVGERSKATPLRRSASCFRFVHDRFRGYFPVHFIPARGPLKATISGRNATCREDQLLSYHALND